MYYEKIGNTSACIQSEIPFEIPKNWTWIRLNEVGIFKKGPFGSSLTKEMFVPEQAQDRVKVYEQKNAIQKDYKLGHYFISKQKFEEMKGFVVSPGDIIVSCAGTIGEIYVLPIEAETGIINQALMRICLYCKEIEEYFLLYFDSVLKKEANEKGNGTGMKNIPPFDVLKKMLIPIPPKAELNRIMSTIDLLCSKANIIQKSFNSLNELSLRIKSKVLDAVFGENSSYKSYYCYTPLEKEIITVSLSNKKVKTKEVLKQGKYKVVSQSKNDYDGFTNDEDKIIHDLPCVVFGDHTRIVKKQLCSFAPGADGTKVIKPKNLNIDYFYYCVLYASLLIENRGYGRHFALLKKQIIPIANEAIQIKVVNFIDESFKLLDNVTQ